MLELLNRNNIAPGIGRGASLFLLDTMVTWRDIENFIEMSQRFCPGLSMVLEVIDVLLPVITDMINLSFESRTFAFAWKEALVPQLLKKVVSRLRLGTFLQLVTFLTSLNYQKRRQLSNSPIIWQLMTCICSFNLHINNITALSRRC